jgi:hypothetical protein
MRGSWSELMPKVCSLAVPAACALLLCLSVAVPAAFAATQPAHKDEPKPPAPTVEWTEQRLTVICVDAPLKDVLRAVSVKTGFPVHGLDNIVGLVSAEFESLPLARALGVLLKGYNYVALGDLTLTSNDPPVILVIGPIEGERANASPPVIPSDPGSATSTQSSPKLSPGPPAQQRSKSAATAAQPQNSQAARGNASQGAMPDPSTAATSPLPSRSPLPPAPAMPSDPPSLSKDSGREIAELVRTHEFSELETAAANNNQERLARALSSRDPAVQVRAFDLLVALDPRAAGDAALAAVRQAPTAASRLQALQFLEVSRVAQPDLVNALAAAAKDPDSEVRSFAILALGRHGGDQGLSVLSDLLRDSDPAVRLLVLQSAAQTSSGRVVISQATGDSDLDVRNMARELLRGMGGEQ